MRIAIVSDIHANAPALEAVLADIRRCGVDRIVHLGDLVGYNGLPRETLALVRAHGIPGVHGNHDLMAVGRLAPDHCGPLARKAIAWTRGVLTPEELGFLASLPGEEPLASGVIGLHSALRDPVVRLQSAEQFHEAVQALQRFDPTLELCFSGHTHVPGAVEVRPDGVLRHGGTRLTLTPGAFWFANPGSVGHPRDADPRAAYAVFDVASRSILFRRVRYDHARLLRENARLGLVAERSRPRLIEALRGRARTAARAIARFLESAP